MKHRSLLFLLLGIVWFVTVVIGFIQLYNYEFKAGTADKLAEQWPQGTSIERQPPLWQLIMAAHPHCPCTRASIGELEKIMTQAQGQIQASVFFLKPPEFAEQWAHTDTYNHALRIPGVRVIVDEDGKQTKLFGAATSGHTFLYDSEGKLVFSGGITSSRGHFGDNAGVNTVIALVNHQPVDTTQTPFFGCLLEKDKNTDE